MEETIRSRAVPFPGGRAACYGLGLRVIGLMGFRSLATSDRRESKERNAGGGAIWQHLSVITPATALSL